MTKNRVYQDQDFEGLKPSQDQEQGAVKLCQDQAVYTLLLYLIWS